MLDNLVSGPMLKTRCCFIYSRAVCRPRPAYTLGDTPEQRRVQPLVRVFHGLWSPPHVVGLQLPAPLPHDTPYQKVPSLGRLVDFSTVDEHALRVAFEFRPYEVLVDRCFSYFSEQGGGKTFTWGGVGGVPEISSPGGGG